MSTAGSAPIVSLAEALFAGPAPDGGLYVPEHLEPVPEADWRRLDGRELADTALLVGHHLLAEDLSPGELDEIIGSSLDFPVPLVELEEGCFALELFHGPTLAFKDVGARFMARLMEIFLRRQGGELTILAATSGDTGSAVAHAFFAVPGIRVVVLFPRGQVSEAQQKLFTTLGGNVLALSVAGSFDDCQRLVRAAFDDAELRRRRPLASANSINVGRLLPQVFYYFHLVAQLEEPPAADRPLCVATPSGNFGNLTAGLLAKRLGLPIARFVAATNRNDVVPDYLKSGSYRPRPSVPTLSNAMDVGSPSNLERILHLYDHDLEALRLDLVGSAHSDEETLAAIREVDRRCGYLLDPHSAVGYLGLRTTLVEAGAGSGVRGAFLATAHPAKFADTVAGAIGRPVPLPPALAERLEMEESVVEIEADEGALREVLTAGG